MVRRRANWTVGAAALTLILAAVQHALFGLTVF